MYFYLLFREKASELKKAIFLVKSHVDAGHDRRLSHLFSPFPSSAIGAADSDSVGDQEGDIENDLDAGMPVTADHEKENIHIVDELEEAASALLSECKDFKESAD